jgi:hypothetical protein
VRASRDELTLLRRSRTTTDREYLFGTVQPGCRLSFIPFSGKQSPGPVKRATASRLSKAGMATSPLAPASLCESGQIGDTSIVLDSVERRNAQQELRKQKYALDRHAMVTPGVRGTIPCGSRAQQSQGL